MCYSSWIIFGFALYFQVFVWRKYRNIMFWSFFFVEMNWFLCLLAAGLYLCFQSQVNAGEYCLCRFRKAFTHRFWFIYYGFQIMSPHYYFYIIFLWNLSHLKEIYTSLCFVLRLCYNKYYGKCCNVWVRNTHPWTKTCFFAFRVTFEQECHWKSCDRCQG